MGSALLIGFAVGVAVAPFFIFKCFIFENICANSVHALLVSFANSWSTRTRNWEEEFYVAFSVSTSITWALVVMIFSSPWVEPADIFDYSSSSTLLLECPVALLLFQRESHRWADHLLGIMFLGNALSIDAP